MWPIFEKGGREKSGEMIYKGKGLDLSKETVSYMTQGFINFKVLKPNRVHKFSKNLYIRHFNFFFFFFFFFCMWPFLICKNLCSSVLWVDLHFGIKGQNYNFLVF